MGMMISAIMAAAAAGAPVPADVADVRCVAVFSTLAGDGVPGVELSEEQKSGLASLVMYYVGKLEGRGNRIDIEASLLRELGPDDSLDRLVREDLPRCGKETESQGAMLTQLGKRLEETGK
jgi:hypothetical protein